MLAHAQNEREGEGKLGPSSSGCSLNEETSLGCYRDDGAQKRQSLRAREREKECESETEEEKGKTAEDGGAGAVLNGKCFYAPQSAISCSARKTSSRSWSTDGAVPGA